MAGGSRFRVTPAAAPEQPEIKQLQNALLVPPPLLRDACCRGGCGPAARVQWLDVGGALGRLHSVVATRDDV